MTIRELTVRLGIKTDPKGLQRAQQGIATLRNSALSLGRLFIGGAVAYGFKRMIDVASDIEETANKFAVVFGEAGDSVQAQLDDISKRTGATNMELQQMASDIGAIIRPALGSAQAAGKMAAGITELALDLNSLNNVPVQDALVALRAAMVGSTEPLMNLGIDTRVAALEQFALEKGIQKNVKSMSEGERMALRYDLIMQRLTDQGTLGDATRTAKGFANASRHLWSALKQLVGMAMGFLLPAVTKLVNNTRTIVDAVEAWFKENKALVSQRVDKFVERFGRVVSATATFFGRVIDATREWYGELGDVGKTIVKIGMLAAGLALVLLLPGGPILLLLALVGLLIEDFETWRAGGESVIGDLIAWFKQLDQAIWSGVLATFDALQASIKSIGQAISDWADRNVMAVRAVTSAVATLAIVVGSKLVMAHWAAWLATAKYLLFAIKYYAVTGAAALKAGVMAQGAGLKAALAWLKAAAPLAAIIALGYVIIFVFQDIVAMLRGQESFFKTLVDGFWNLVDQLGSIRAAIKEMLDTAIQYWLRFFGTSEKKAKAWANAIARTLTTALDILTKPLQLVIKAGEFVADKLGIAESLGFGVETPEPGQGAAGVITRPRIEARPTPIGGPNSRTMVDRSRTEINVEVRSQPGMSEERLSDLFVEKLTEARERERRQTFYDFGLEGATGG